MASSWEGSPRGNATPIRGSTPPGPPPLLIAQGAVHGGGAQFHMNCTAPSRGWCGSGAVWRAPESRAASLVVLVVRCWLAHHCPPLMEHHSLPGRSGLNDSGAYGSSDADAEDADAEASRAVGVAPVAPVPHLTPTGLPTAG